MTKYEIEPFNWQYFLNQLSKELENKTVHVEITGENIGDLFKARDITLIELIYDNKKDTLKIVCDQLVHLIKSPLTISFQQDQGVMNAIEILDDNVKKNVVKFKDPLLVPHS
jgi:hypothetical protein